MHTDLVQSAAQLANARAETLGDRYKRIASLYGHLGVDQIEERIGRVAPKERGMLRLLLAEQILLTPTAGAQRDVIDHFLAWFASHLDSSLWDEGKYSLSRPILAYATQRAFFASNLTSLQKKQNLRKTAAGQPSVSEHLWMTNLGVSKDTFDAIMDGLKADHQDFLTSFMQTVPDEGLATVPVREVYVQVGTEPAARRLPTWMTFGASQGIDELMSASRNWDDREIEEHSAAVDLPTAWRLFCEQDFAAARDCMPGLFGQVPVWQPTSDVDGVRLWNWIRAVNQLADIQLGAATSPRRAAASAFDLVYRALPDHEDLLDYLVDTCLGDFAATDSGTTRAWCAYSSRLIARAGHEYVLANYSNAEKAALRQALAGQFDVKPEDARATNLIAGVVSSEVRHVAARLAQGARGGEPASVVLREVRRVIAMCADDDEQELFDQALELAVEIGRIDRPNHEDLEEQSASLQSMVRSIRVSGSVFLQDGVLPHLHNLESQIVKADSMLTDISRPEVRVLLDSPRLPLSASKGSTFFVRLRLVNAGNAPAQLISIHLKSRDAGIDSMTSVPVLNTGAEVVCEVPLTSTGDSTPTVTMIASVTWSDSLKQQFAATETLTAEDQKPASWQASDVNPFSLSTISDPSRLVGRQDDLDTLDAMLAGGGSIYVTGQKRVGKTSLVRVLLETARRSRDWGTSYLPLGRALGPQREASELVYALMDSVYDAARSAYPQLASSITPIEPDPNGNFSRAANRWLGALAGVLPANSRIVVVIDDFDELPAELITGPQADSMFLFFRTLVDEDWLNLIMVGSEILPSIINAQAHKLNQVARYSVSNFSSRSSSESLLTTPTKFRLEWDAAAIDRVHYMCGGNPYYETLVAQHLWQALREQSRSSVSISDVNQSLVSVANEAPPSHFMHLWADGAFGMDHTSRLAMVTSAALRAVARCSKGELAASDKNEVVRVAQSWISSARADELNAIIIDLVGRQVLDWGPSDGTVILNIPLVSEWLVRAGGRALDTKYAASPHATSAAYVVTESDLAELSRGLIYRGEAISEIRLQAWLKQFGESYYQYLAYKMLKRMILEFYFTHTRLHEKIYPKLVSQLLVLPGAGQVLRDNNQYLKNAFLLLHGQSGDSSQAAFIAIGKQLKIKKANMLGPAELVERLTSAPKNSNHVVFIVDDYAGSGGHLRQTFSILLEQLDPSMDGVSDRLRVLIGVGVAAGQNALDIAHPTIAVESAAGMVLGDRCRPFVDGSGLFATSKEKSDAQDLVATIGRSLLPNNPLGFGNEALLTLFELNCPNNAPPIFWRSGQIGGRRWMPLFERLL